MPTQERRWLQEEMRGRCSDCEMSIKMRAPVFTGAEDNERRSGNMPVDSVENWKKFSEHMEEYIRDRTVEKYEFGDVGEGGFVLMTITRPDVCVWNILRYALGIHRLQHHGSHRFGSNKNALCKLSSIGRSRKNLI